jgi:hypothetical protein
MHARPAGRPAAVYLLAVLVTFLAIGEIDVLMTPDQRQDLLQRLAKHMAAVGKR